MKEKYQHLSTHFLNLQNTVLNKLTLVLFFHLIPLQKFFFLMKSYHDRLLYNEKLFLSTSYYSNLSKNTHFTKEYKKLKQEKTTNWRVQFFTSDSSHLSGRVYHMTSLLHKLYILYCYAWQVATGDESRALYHLNVTSVTLFCTFNFIFILLSLMT
jgi:hypothetical protein